ncbi:very-long-chain 3-oxoacyl-CoA reductase-B-like [Dendrobates tinctorius]|uniref:very-long-chain 3-oxoacyl-CoA reductase-B-like n=1 Tax=Dendrobates tinctorius TaxID=92724 RepID=UPI003CC9DB4C
MDCLLSQGLNLLGQLALCYLVTKQLWIVLKGFRVHFLSRVWRTDLKKYGGWAVVTGATDGIGKSYAEELAKRGFDVVLISRTLEKLKNVAKGIEEKTRRKTKVIQLDFTGGPEIYPRVEKELKDLDIGILVNNVGMTIGPQATVFLDVPDLSQKVTDVMNCNMTSAVQMTAIVLPKMVQRRKGLIINVSSQVGAHPCPLTNIYSATKAFLDYFSRSLYIEYKSKGIMVQSVLPMFVSTNMTQNLPSNLLIKTAPDFVREALNTVGYTHRTNGCLSHSIQGYIINNIISDTLMASKLMEKIAKSVGKSMEEAIKQKEK